MTNFENKLAELKITGLTCDSISILQVNLGRKCNLACAHCHLDCSPDRTEMMSKTTLIKILELVKDLDDVLVDITGGAPEMHTDYMWFIEMLAGFNAEIQFRTNLTLLSDDATARKFLAQHKVRLVASLPCYLEENVDSQRGSGTYTKSIEAIRKLNELGYGINSGLQLNLVYNPSGPFLPGDQTELEQAYKKELLSRFGIEFTNLIAITNMPLGRFNELLEKDNKEDEYMQILSDAFNPDTLNSLMCRHQICIDWDGSLYDCDFNLSLGMKTGNGSPSHIDHFDLNLLKERKIVTAAHCYGCTAGAGSSCAGSLAS